MLATEAFDLAGNPLAFPEQVEAPRDQFNINNYGEGLRPWQPKKIYYFSDTTHFDSFKGNDPEYPTSETSPSRNAPYSRIVAEAWASYKTQGDFTDDQLKEFSERPVRLIFGKSLVGGSPTGDVFEGINSTPIAYVPARGYQPPPPDLGFELGGPWAFYHQFWPAHNIEHLASLYPPEAQVTPGESLWVRLLIRNNTNRPKQVSLRSSLPPGWKQQPEWTLYKLEPHESYTVQSTLLLLPHRKAPGKT